MNFEATQQTEIDEFMLKLDGTPNKSKLGANAILGVSLAVCKAGAAKKGVPLYRHIADLAGVPDLVLPVPAFNVINGGSHAGNKLAMQEFMVLPTGAASFTEAMKMGSEVYHHLKKVIKDKFGLDATAVGDEGGFAPNILDNKAGLLLIKEAIEKAGYTGKVEIGMDVAASEFYRRTAGYTLLDRKRNEEILEQLEAESVEEKITRYKFNWLDHVRRVENSRIPKIMMQYKPRGHRRPGRPEGKYDLDFKNPQSDKSKWIDAKELTNLYMEFIKEFPVVSIEDPFDQDHWDAWAEMTANTPIQFCYELLLQPQSATSTAIAVIATTMIIAIISVIDTATAIIIVNFTYSSS
ncbi:hypothetical protein ANN_19735 [Periplaneta americana]|uniref:Enolase n=1 Tax=Periplaneta americana TaxID=6978 RepID=A0ABQ8SAW7_PERAM|nr:hypothetical protein ANN_19735 [Periplaneta americana]